MKKPIDLQRERIKRERQAGEAAHARGKAFALLPFDFDGTGVGVIDKEERDKEGHSIVLIFNPDAKEGLTMTAETATQLAVALLKATGVVAYLDTQGE